jgi:hypothetical protein
MLVIIAFTISPAFKFSVDACEDEPSTVITTEICVMVILIVTTFGNGGADADGLGDGVAVGLAVGVGIPVGVAVGVGDGTNGVVVGIAVGLAVGLTVGEGITVGVGMAVGVTVGVAVGVGVGVGVGIMVEVMKPRIWPGGFCVVWTTTYVFPAAIMPANS